jgi:hypothetical protein
LTKSNDPSGSRRPPTIPYASGAPSISAEKIDAPLEPPLPPRPITPLAARRSWTDPRVRFWWLASLALLAIGIWFVVEQVIAAQNEAHLIHDGTVVMAKVTTVLSENDSRPGRYSKPDSEIALKFDWKGEPTNVTGVLKDTVRTGDTVQIRVDPEDPTRWTDHTEAEPLGRRLIAGAVIFPTVLATGLWAALMHRRILRTWRDGEAEAYSVVDMRHTALAPLSHAVRGVTATGRDRRLVLVYLPGKHPRPEPGEVIWFIHPRGKPSASIAAPTIEGSASPKKAQNPGNQGAP